MKEKRFIINYCSGATGYGWREEADSLNDFQGLIKEIRGEYTARLTIWDSTKKDFIFYKRALSYPEIDNIK